MQSGSSPWPIPWRRGSSRSNHRSSVGRRVVGLWVVGCVVVVGGRRNGGSMGPKRCGGYSGCWISRLGEFVGIIGGMVVYAMSGRGHGIAYGHSSLHLGVFGDGSI